MRLLFFLSLPLTLLYGCDNNYWGSSDAGKDSYVTIVTDSSKQCKNCKGKVYAVNNRNKKTKTTISVTYSDDRDDETRTITLGPIERSYLGCSHISSKDASPGFPNCTVTQSFSVTSSDYASYYMVDDIKLATISISSGLLDDMQIVNRQCARECLEPNHPDNEGECLTFRKTGQRGDASRLSNILSYLVTNYGSNVKKSELMKRFNLSDDPCLRSDLDLRNGSIKNDGKSCLIEARLSEASNLDTKSVLQIPEKVRGDLLSSGGGVLAKFSKSDEAVAINFPEKPDLTSDYGGLIYKMETKSGVLVVTTENGCLGWKYH